MDLGRLPPPDLPSSFSVQEAEALGFSRRQIRYLITAGVAGAPFRGVRALGIQEDLGARVRAAGLVLPRGAAFSRRTAAELLGVDPRSPSERGQVLPLECTVPRGRTPLRHPGVRSFSAPLPAMDIAGLRGVPCTTASRTAADLLRWLPGFMALAVVDAMAHAALISVPDVSLVLERYPGDRHVAKARRLLGLVEPKTESYGESWQRLRLVDAGFPPPEVQIPIHDGSGREVYRLDMGYPDRMVAFEYDGLEFHDEATRRGVDQERRDDLRKRFGWTVISCARGEILGRSMAFELAAGAFLAMSPVIYQRSW